jgi:NAD(P)-dependent dehydrogenase (short-subunit alcohol dehydrogenase family)
MSQANQRLVAFITGAASGIGQAAAQQFACKNYAVVIADMNETAGEEFAERLRQGGAEAMFVATNVMDDASAQAAVERTAASYGRLDAAFNAAGTDGEFGKQTADCSIDNWHRVIGVNLTGVWSCMRHQIPQMLRNGGGAIVNCASTAGLRGAPTCAAYCASKHGVIGLTKAAALEYGLQGVRINAVCPGMIDTPMTRAGGMGELIPVLAQQTPLERLGQPEEIAQAVVWLCSDEASFVLGQAWAVDGGITSR